MSASPSPAPPGEYNGLTQLTGPQVTPPAADCAKVIPPTELATLPETDADKEPYEGMLVLPKGTYTITNNYQLNQFGQLGLAVGDKPLYQATEKVAPPVPTPRRTRRRT